MLNSRNLAGRRYMAVETRYPDIFRFAMFEVDVRAGELRKQGVRIRVQEQPFHVLTVLLRRPGEVVTRDELRNQNWSPDTFVDFDNSLNTAINKLREALGDSADNPRFIETLPRRGYRFIAAVTSDDRKKPATNLTDWKIVLPAAVALLAVSLGGTAVWWHSRQGHRLTEKDTIVLADFANSTGEAVFDDTLKQGLSVQLEQSPFLNILSEQKVAQTLTLMGRAPEQRLTLELARDLCQRIGSKATLSGTISRLGTHYVIGLNAVNCETGDTLANEQVEADSREHVLKALGELASKMREKLGESLASIQKYDAPVERTTTSLEALKAFSLGQQVWQVKGDTAALPFFQRAVEIDPKFAAAYGRMGTIYNELSEYTLSAENTRRAYELRNKVSPRERLYIESHYHFFVTGELEKAAQVFEVWQQTYPQDLTPYNNLAALYPQFGKYENALEEARQQMRLYPDIVDSYSNLGSLCLFLGRLDEAEAVFRQTEERKLENEYLLTLRYQWAFLKADRLEMERMARTAAGEPGEDQLLSEQSDTEAYYGRLANARRLSRRAVESARHAGKREAAALWQVNAALREAEFGNTISARQDGITALAWAPGRGVKELAALALARAGNIAEAQKRAEELNKDFVLDTMLQFYWLPAIRAAIELNRKNPHGAVKLLEAAAPYELGVPDPLLAASMYPVYLRGQAYLLAHQGNEAANEFRKIMGHRTIVLNFPLGALSHLGLARAYALQGDTTKAQVAYNDFLALWKDGDSDIPVLNQAKAEYAKLR